MTAEQEYERYVGQQYEVHIRDEQIAALEARIAELETDAALGRLVRAMPDDTLLLRWGNSWERHYVSDIDHRCDECFIFYTMRDDKPADAFNSTPEEALSSAEEG